VIQCDRLTLVGNMRKVAKKVKEHRCFKEFSALFCRVEFVVASAKCSEASVLQRMKKALLARLAASGMKGSITA
jgi:hypothetical protein